MRSTQPTIDQPLHDARWTAADRPRSRLPEDAKRAIAKLNGNSDFILDEPITVAIGSEVILETKVLGYSDTAC